jgi:hypothetical protein
MVAVKLLKLLMIEFVRIESIDIEYVMKIVERLASKAEDTVIRGDIAVQSEIIDIWSTILDLIDMPTDPLSSSSLHGKLPDDLFIYYKFISLIDSSGLLDRFRTIIVSGVTHDKKNQIRSEWIGLAMVLTRRQGTEEYIHDMFQDIITSLCNALAETLSLLLKNDGFYVDYPNLHETIMLIQKCIHFLFARKSLIIPDASQKTIAKGEAGSFRIFSGLISAFSGETESTRPIDSTNKQV